jgi:L-rhamnose mutarotase
LAGILKIRECHIKHYSIYQKNGFLFAYFEYNGEDFTKDMLKMAADPITQEWWEIMRPMQQPVTNHLNNEWLTNMEKVFHLE